MTIDTSTGAVERLWQSMRIGHSSTVDAERMILAIAAERDDYADQMANLLPAVNREAVQMRAERDTQAAEIERLRDMLDKDVASILKGRDVVQPHTHLFEGQDTTSYWKLRAEMGDAAAIRAVKISEEYRLKAVKTQRRADTEADQASERFKKERTRCDAAVAALTQCQADARYALAPAAYSPTEGSTE